MFVDAFRGTKSIVGLILRRDRVRLPVWIGMIALFTIGISGGFPALYPTAEERGILAGTLDNPAMVAMVGPAYGIHDYTYGAMVAHQMLLFMAMGVAVMNILFVTRHTRGDEERGRTEMIQSLPVGRLATLASTLLVLTVANAALALVTALGLVALGVESIDWTGSLVFGAAIGVIGMVFAGVTAVFAQVAETSRSTLGLSFGAFGFAYLLRAIGDIGSEPLALISPLGLILRTQAFVHNYGWPIGVLAAGAVSVFAFALYLNALRDVGAGLLRPRPGREHAGPFLKTPLGLALRLQRTTIIGWTVAAFILGAAYGSVFGDLESFFESSDVMKQLLPMMEGVSLTEQFAGVIILVMAMVSTVPALLVTMKLYAEEQAHRVDPILATAVSRRGLLASYLALAALVGLLGQVAGALGLWLASSSVMTDALPPGRIMGAALAYGPAILAMVGLAAAIVGWRPKLALLAWGYLTYTFVVLYLGGLLQLPTWMEKTTLFGYVPQLSVDDVRPWGLVFLLIMAAVATAVGIAGYRRRDIGV